MINEMWYYLAFVKSQIHCDSVLKAGGCWETNNRTQGWLLVDLTCSAEFNDVFECLYELSSFNQGSPAELNNETILP